MQLPVTLIDIREKTTPILLKVWVFHGVKNGGDWEKVAVFTKAIPIKPAFSWKAAEVLTIKSALKLEVDRENDTVVH